MTRLPRDPLDADERALAARLPRLHGRDEPDAAMDARILAAAHAALSPATPRKRRRGWIVPLTAAASVSLAVGLAWQLQSPQAPTAIPTQRPVAIARDASEAGQAPVQQDQAAPPPPADAIQSMNMPSSPRPVSSPADAREQVNRAAAPAASAAEPVADAPMFVPPPPAAPMADAMSAPVMSPPPAPPAPPAPAAAAMARATPTDAATSATGAIPAQAQAKRVRNEAEVAAEALTAEDFAKAVDEEDVPPATMDGPAARDAWLRRIGELQQQGRVDDAKASLAEFRRRYPDAVLPTELRKLEP